MDKHILIKKISSLLVPNVEYQREDIKNMIKDIFKSRLKKTDCVQELLYIGIRMKELKAIGYEGDLAERARKDWLDLNR